MPSLIELLPIPPAGFQRFAWNGIPLLLPDAWNLQLHIGTPRQGALVFVDMERPRLELRWRRASAIWPHRARPEQLLERAVNRLQKDSDTAITARPTHTEIRRASSLTILMTHEDRLIELHWPMPAHVEEISEDFITSCRRVAGNRDRLWSVYGTTGAVPRSFSVKLISMVPGATRLEFRRGSRRATLGSFSLADRLLGADTLRAWAMRTIPFLQNHPDAVWHERSHAAVITTCTRDILPWRKIAHTLELRHDSQANRIQWIHRAMPA